MERPVLFHDSRSTIYRAPFGAVPACGRITLRLDAAGSRFTRVLLRLWQEGTGETLVPMQLLRKGESKGKETGTGKTLLRQRYTVTVSLPETGCLVWYYFQIQTEEGRVFYYGNNETKSGGIGQSSDYEPPSFQITVYEPDSSTPKWLKEAVIYQIFPDRFNRGQASPAQFMGKKDALLHSCWEDDPHYVKEPGSGAVLQYDFFGGTIEGIREKLEYLEDLGVTCVYLNPVFQSRSNHRYDTGDYKKIDPFLGTEQDLARLCREARQRGIRILLDGVFSHTGADSLYFNRYGRYPGQGAYQSETSPYFSWYRFTGHPDHYAGWWGDKSLPEVDETNPAYLDFIIEGEDSVLCYWLRAGISGWRLDVADELPDVFLQAFYRKLKREDKEAVLLGEVWEDASNKVSYGRQRAYLCGGKVDGVMNYPLRAMMLDFVQGRSDAARVNDRYLQQMENYPPENLYAMMNLLGSHDVERILTLLQDDSEEKPGEAAACSQVREAVSVPNPLPARQGSPSEEKAFSRGEKRLILLWAWQMTLPGAPSIYYGDEAGLEGGTDPDNRRTYPWGRENTRLRAKCRELIRLRRHYAALRTGRMIPVYATGDVYVYARSIEGKRDVFGEPAENGIFFIALNRGGRAQSLTVDTGQLAYGELRRLSPAADQSEALPVVNGCFALTLEPYGYGIFQCSQTKGEEVPRQAGILLHPTSLPGEKGPEKVKQAERFIDFLATAGQKIWQILPLAIPDAAGSPYNSPSAFAGDGGLFTRTGEEPPQCIKRARLVWNWNAGPHFTVVREDGAETAAPQAADSEEPAGFAQFCWDNRYWLPDYILYRALQERFGGKPWQVWPASLRQRDATVLAQYAEELAGPLKFYAWEQYEFQKAWHRIKQYANARNISIFGDLPMFVASDSADCWSHPEYFYLDEPGYPLESAGVPPDYFSAGGQIWGNPLYRWERMEQDSFCWWVERLRCLSDRVDWLRMDHFRGFEACWAVPRKASDASVGRWIKGPGKKLFAALRTSGNRLTLIAEDLGMITPEVCRLKQALGLPGMRILQFHCRNRADGYCDFATEPHCVAYTGTHDNNTLRGWWEEEVAEEEKTQILTMLRWEQETPDAGQRICGASGPEEPLLTELLAYVYSRQARSVIVPMQDFLMLASDCRMNRPGTTGGNWSWQAQEADFSVSLSQKIAAMVNKYNRN